MEIVINNDLFEVIENGDVLYVAQTNEEALGFIEWKNRASDDAGNPEDCVTC